MVLLSGELGSGKTIFASGIAEGLGVEKAVTSPSFVLARPYQGLLPMIHADVYRIDSIAELDDLDLLEAASDGVLVVEWGQAVEGSFPNHLMVRLEIAGPDERHIHLLPRGGWQDRPLGELAS